MESMFTHPTRTGQDGHAYKFHQHRCFTRHRQYAFSTWTVQFWNKLPTEIVNASPVKSFKTQETSFEVLIFTSTRPYLFIVGLFQFTVNLQLIRPTRTSLYSTLPCDKAAPSIFQPYDVKTFSIIQDFGWRE